MTDTLTHTQSIEIVGGPSISATNHFEAGAYDKIEAVIPKNSVATEVNVQPGDVADMQAIMILADVYDDLVFEVDEIGDSHTLDGPLVLIGAGNIALLGTTCNVLTFTNANVSTDRNITVLVARTPT